MPKLTKIAATRPLGVMVSRTADAGSRHRAHRGRIAETDEQQLHRLTQQGVTARNAWRERAPDPRVDLRKANTTQPVPAQSMNLV